MTDTGKLTMPYGPRRRPWRETLSNIAIVRQDGTLLVSPPSFDPLSTESSVPKGISPALYQVPSTAVSSSDSERAMEETLGMIREGSQRMFGFMVNTNIQCLQYMESPFTSVMCNAAGDPFAITKPYHFSTKWFERNVLDYFASLWNAKWPHDPSDPESYWGYVLTMGSSEGNLHALWSARNYLTPGAAAEPVLFVSQNANFSIAKLADIVSLKQFYEVGRDIYPDQNPLGGDWVEGVPCVDGDTGPGSIDIDSLENLVDFFSEKGHPIIVVFNYGTTLKGTCDDVKSAGERLVGVLKKNKMFEQNIQISASTSVVRKRFWFHVDGALCASYMPFLEMAYKNSLTDIRPASPFDFRLKFVSSIVTSGHKFIGTPWPTGVYLTRTGLLCNKDQSTSITGSTDTTISLSRNAHSAILLWSYISRHSYDDQASHLLRSLKLVSYTINELKKLEKKIGLDLMINNFPPSLSILFRKPSDHMVLKYSLSVSSLQIGSQNQDFAQIYVMGHLTQDKIDSFITDLLSPDAFSNEL